jgi:hypothetical protein
MPPGTEILTPTVGRDHYSGSSLATPGPNCSQTHGKGIEKTARRGLHSQYYESECHFHEYVHLYIEGDARGDLVTGLNGAIRGN